MLFFHEYILQGDHYYLVNTQIWCGDEHYKIK